MQALMFHNTILSALPRGERDQLIPSLEPVILPKDFVIAASQGPISHVYFPEKGIVSVLSVSGEGKRVEAGMIGNEGYGPTPPAVGSDVSFHELVIQAMGHGHRLPVPLLPGLMQCCPVFARLLAKSSHNLATQVSYTALSNAVHQIAHRLARWLLMSHDRLGHDELTITHDYLALMLAVRRPSVTTALHVLEGHRFIRSDRGTIVMRNRAAMETFAGDAYGKPEAEHRLLFGAAA